MNTYWWFAVSCCVLGVILMIHGGLTLPWRETSYGFTNEGLDLAIIFILAAIGFIGCAKAEDNKVGGRTGKGVRE